MHSAQRSSNYSPRILKCVSSKLNWIEPPPLETACGDRPNPERVLLIPHASSSVATATIIPDAKIESEILLVRGPAMAIEFRSDLKGIWHWCSDCRYWPANSFDIVNTQKLPPGFKSCPQCTVLAPIDGFIALSESPSRSLRPKAR